MEKNLHKLIQQVAYPILYTVLYIPGSAGCLPSTVSPAHFLAKKSCCFGWFWRSSCGTKPQRHRFVARHVNQLWDEWMPLVWPPPNNSDHQTNYQIFSRGSTTKKKEAPLTVEAGILGRGVRLHWRYAKLTLTWKQKFASPGRSGAFREVRGVKDAMAARGASRFFSGRRCPPFLGPRSPADDMFWQQGIPMQK